MRTIVTLALYCFLLTLIPEDSFANDALVNDSLTKSFQIKEEETQLAQRFAVRESVESPFEYSLGAGFRQDNLSWSIADGSVNVASEVTWKKTVIAQLRAAGKLRLGNDWLLRGQYATGVVRSGSNQDSDYAGSNRTQEYSRSNNKTGGAVSDLSIGIGRRIHLLDIASTGALYVVPLAGLSVHQQNLTMTDGQQIIPFNEAITGLHNSYDTEWKGAWLGLDTMLGLGEKFSLNSSMEYHLADYSAEGNWNLRGDLAHPVSFKHVANGYGRWISVGASYRHSRNFLLNASLERQRWKTYTGYDQTYFANGSMTYYTLNPVRWTSVSFSLWAVYQF